MEDQDWQEIERSAVGTVRPEVPPLPELYFTFDGRISRRTYWLYFMVPSVLLSWGLQALDAALFGMGTLGIFYLVSFLPLTYLGVVGFWKRLHDLDIPGWYIPVGYGSFIVGAMLTGAAWAVVGELALLLAVPLVVVGILSFWYSLKASFIRGTTGPNRFGPDPLQRRL